MIITLHRALGFRSIALTIMAIGFWLPASHAQFCGTATLVANITPTATVQSSAAATGARRYWTFTATAGVTYNFNTCGAAAQDTYLRIYNAAGGGTQIAADDDGCGTTRSDLTWTCPANGTYSVLLTRYAFLLGNCLALNTGSTLFYSIPPTPCTTITNITACGVNQTATLSGSGGGWNLTSCGFTTPGQERVYSFTPSATGVHQLQVMSASGGYVDYFWKLASGGCSNTGWTCIDDLNAAATVNLPSWTAGQQVLIVLDAEATTSMTHTFRINCPIPVPTNDLCANAITIPGAGPFPHLTAMANNTSATNTGQPTPSCQATSNASIWYNFTPACSGDYRFSTCQNDAPSSDAIDHVLVIASGACGGTFTEFGCNDDASTACAASGLSSIIPSVTLSAGTLYRVIAYTYSTARGNIQIQTRMIAPTITEFSQSVGCIGSPLTITGTNIGCATSVTIGGQPAPILSNSTTSIVVSPSAAATGPVVITCPAGTVSSAGGVGNYTVEAPLAATVNMNQNCGAGTFTASVNVTSYGSGSVANLLYTVNGSPTYLPNIGLGTTVIGPFPTSALVQYNVSNGSVNCSAVTGYAYSTCTYNFICGNSVQVDHCYTNIDGRTFTFQTNSFLETVTVNLSGCIEPNDAILAYDGPNTGFPQIGTITGVSSLNGLSFVSTGPAIHLVINSNGSNSCTTGQQCLWSMEAFCTPGCDPPSANVTLMEACPNFNLDVYMNSTGDGSTATLRYTENGGAPQFVTGLLTGNNTVIGPFAGGSVINLKLLHESDAACDVTLGNYTGALSCPAAENCGNAQNLASQTSPLNGTTVGRSHDFSMACGSAAANTAPDAIYFMDVPNGYEFRMRQVVNNYNSLHFMRYGGACPGTTPIACIDDEGGETAWVFWTNTTGSTQRVWWIQDGVGTATGTFTLEWLLLPCGVAPTAPTIGVGGYTICQGSTVPGGEGLTATCAPIARTISVPFTSGIISEGTTLTNRGNVTVPALPGGAVVTAARLKLFNVVANTGLAGVDAQRQNLRVALSGAYTLAQLQVTTQTGPGTISPDPIINLPGFPAAGGTINIQTRQTTDNIVSNPDVSIRSATIEVDFTLPSNLGWYTAPAAGTLASSISLFDPVGAGAVNNNTPGTTAFHASCAFAACESVRMPTSFSVTATPTAAVVGIDQTICTASITAGLGGNTPVNGTGAWSIVSGGGGTFNPNATTPNATFTHTSGSGPVVLRWTISNAPCAASIADLNVNITQPPSASNNGGDQTICANGTTSALGGNTPVVGTGAWNIVSGGSGTFSNSASPASTFTHTGGLGPVVLRWTISNAPCAASTSDLNVNITQPPSTATVGNSQDVCAQSTSAGLGGNTPAIGTGAWSIVSGGTGTFNPNAAAPNATFTHTGGTGPVVLRWTISNAPCVATSSADVSLNILQEGMACDAGPGFVLGALDANCNCVGQACTTDIDFIYQSDNAHDLFWQLREQSSNILVQDLGGALMGSGSQGTCLPNGCFYLVVTDGGGDGIAAGGYILRINSAQRLIDNRYDEFGRGGFTLNQATSQIAGNEGFCLPIGTDRLITANCDRHDWRISPCSPEYVVANDNPAVGNFNNTPADATHGYQMWWYDPNGGYSFKRTQKRNVNNGLSIANRATHFRINTATSNPSAPWAAINHLQNGAFYNVKVRGIVNNVFQNWGPACRFMINNAEAQCPRTKLYDQPDPQFVSCRIEPFAIANNVYVFARPVRRLQPSCNAYLSANRYQFRFRIVAENFELIKTGAVGTGQYFVNTSGLACGKTYEVDVRASFDGGATWCHSGDLWGDICLLNTVSCVQGGGNQNMAQQGGASELRMYPNPNRGDQLFVNLTGIDASIETVSVDIYDAFGKRVSARTIAANGDGFVNSIMQLNGELAAGLYTVSITAGEQQFTERLVVQP